ncbi:MAG: hypothetical protein R3A12_00255 [Ignavibacteria bacterium]
MIKQANCFFQAGLIPTNINGEAFAIKSTFDNGFIISGATDYGGTSFNINALVIKTDSLGNTSKIVNIENNGVSFSNDFCFISKLSKSI